MEKERISNNSGKNNNIQNTTNNIESRLLDIFKVEEKNFEEHTNNLWMKKIIIPNNIVEKILNEFWKKELTKEDKELIKKVIKKWLLLHKKDWILFSKWKIYIIPFKHDEKRFNWLDPKDIEFMINEFIKEWFSPQELNKKVIEELNIKNLSKEEIKEFIDWAYKQKLLLEYTKLIKKVIKSELDEDIIKWIAWKLLRENFDYIVNEIFYKILEKFTDNTQEIIEDTTNELIKIINFEDENIDYFELNKSILNKIWTLVKTKINSNFFSKVWTKLNSNLIENNKFTKIITVQVFNNLFNQIAEGIVNKIIEDPYNTKLVKNIDNFLSYYSWKVEIIWKNKYQYPKLVISWINKSENYLENFESYSYKYILNQLLNFAKKYKELTKELQNTERQINESKNKQSELTERKKKIEILINKLDWDIQQLNKQIESKDKKIYELKKEIEKINNEEKKSKLLKIKNSFSWNKEKLKETMQKIIKNNNLLKIKRKELIWKKNNLKTKLENINSSILNINVLEKDKKFYEEQLDKIKKTLNSIKKDLKIQLKQRIKKIS